MKLSLPAILLVLAACAVPPPPSLHVAIAGQVIDRQFREIVVTVVNDGTTTLAGFPVKVELPPGLAIIRESHEGLELRRTESGTYFYVVRELLPGASVTARFPFRRESSAALAGADVHVVAAHVEVHRTLSE